MTEVKINNNNVLVNYQYDSAISDLAEIESYTDGTSVKYHYDYNNRLIDVLIKYSTSVDYTSVYEYEYDSAGRLLSYTENSMEEPTVYNYSYDTYGNLAYVIKNGNLIQENISDSRGNIKERVN
jgi:YD repeat-containing protein